MDKNIKRAEERLEYLSSYEKTIEIYSDRKKFLHKRAKMISGHGFRNHIKSNRIKCRRN